MMPEMMMHCLNSPEATVLEQQLAKLLKWQHQQGTGTRLFQPHTSFYGSGGDGGSSLSFSMGDENLMGLGEVVNQCKIIDPSPGIEFWGQLGKIDGIGGGIGASAPSSGYEVSCGSISRTASCPPTVVAAAAAAEKIGAPVGKGSFKKRKLERVQIAKVSEVETRDKKIRSSSDEMDSKITAQSNKNSSNNNKETSPSTSKDNSKASEVAKPDYIHVRARRGQATDSHSLAERVRREKISERMKFLQDLVPGCNTITGKAGMLDEIINYVQSLQRHVEFLSMKLATVNPRLDFDIDSLFSKEMSPVCTSSFPTVDMSPELTNPTYLHFDPLQQVVSCSGLDMGIINPDMGLRRTTSAPVPVPEPFIDSSCFTDLQQMQPTATWDSDFQNLYNMEFQHGKATATPYQSHQQQYIGPIEATNMKMEI